MPHEDDEDGSRIGYGKPPKVHQFVKGKSGNPAGRPRKPEKPKPINTEAAIMARLDSEIIPINGVEMTRLELELRTLRNKAAKGDMQAHRLLDRKRADLNLNKPKARTGVLAIPMAPSMAEWEKRTAEDQRRYREQTPEDFERLEEELKAAERNSMNKRS